MRRTNFHSCFTGFAALSLVVCGAGCEDRPRYKPEPATVPATAPAEPETPKIDVAKLKPGDPTPAFPGFATGRVVNVEGKPITQDGIRLEVILGGLLDETQGRVTLPVEPGPDGVYIKPLKPGTYLLPTARIEFPFNGKQYRLPLSTHGPALRRQEASEGVVQDFIWKLSGPRPGQKGDKGRPDTWIGGTIYPEYRSYRQDLGRVIKSPPAGTKVEFTLNPKSPLADGSLDKPRVAIRLYNPTQVALHDPAIVDLPLAMWEVRGEEVFPDGTRRPVQFLQSDNRTWGDSVTGTFEADLAESALRPVHITFTRREQ